MCRTNLAFKCDRVSVTMIEDNAPLLLCSDYSSLLHKSIMLAIAFSTVEDTALYI